MEDDSLWMLLIWYDFGVFVKYVLYLEMGGSCLVFFLVVMVRKEKKVEEGYGGRYLFCVRIW